MAHRVAEFLGDGVGPELREAVGELLKALPVELQFRPVDLSLGNREKVGRSVYDEAIEAIREAGVALKYPTVTKGESPNAVLRRMCDFSVIHRPVRSLPGVESLFKGELHLDIVRVATGGTYEDPGRMVGRWAAASLRTMEREACERAARYAFGLARREGKAVTSSSKYTIQRATDGLFEEAVGEVAKGFPDVPYRRELFDALLAKLAMRPEGFGVVILPNEYGDFLSDMACGLVGSLGVGASASFAFADSGEVSLAMFDPTHGTAPDIAGKGVVNPTAIFLTLAMLLRHLREGETAGRLEGAVVGSLAAGERTGDLGGKLTTREFTSRVARRLGAG